MKKAPNYLRDYQNLWENDPHAANLAWFKNARFGMMFHYGLYSQLEHGEWVQLRETVPIEEYEKLKDNFTAQHFDPDYITDLACEAKMQYINMVTCHHDGFCLWDSKVEPTFNSINSPAKRDLVQEMADQCNQKGLGFFTYYTYVINWRHPYALTNNLIKSARHNYPFEEPRYRLTQPEEWTQYWEYSHALIRELLSQQGPIEGIWLDFIMGYYAQPELIPIHQTYSMVRNLQPHVLISFKQGATGDEDFVTPERKLRSFEELATKNYGPKAGMIAAAAWEKNKNKLKEFCCTMQEHWWGCHDTEEHKSTNEVWNMLGYAGKHQANLLLNTGPLSDGRFHSHDVAVFREIGRRIEQQGWPTEGEITSNRKNKQNRNQ